MSGTGHKTNLRWAVALCTVLLVLPGITHDGWLLPCTACRFLRYFAAAQTPEMKATFYEKIVYSFVLASHQNDGRLPSSSPIGRS